MPTVLIADDEASVREFLVQSLTEEGFTVLEAADGLEALWRIKRERPEAVLLDLRMPRLGGLDVLRRLRTFDPTIRVFIITGFPEDAREAAASLGVTGVFPKPIAMRALVGALRADTRPPNAREDSRTSAAVLIVDDDAEVGSTLKDLVEALGHEALWVPDAVSALHAVVPNPPDVVLLDILMPELSGLELLPILRALAPGVPIIMVSGTADEELGRQALARGAVDYVVKPVDIRRLAGLVDLALLIGKANHLE